MAKTRQYGTLDEEQGIFWSRVLRGEGCWEWQGARLNGGYGVMRFQKRQQLTHRIAWQLTIGPIPSGRCICHHCDNPACVRPDHLFVGSHKDNMNDMHSKGRAGDHAWWRRPGRKHHKAILNPKQAEEIRNLYRATDLTHRALAARYGVSAAAIWHVLKNLSYRA